MMIVPACSVASVKMRGLNGCKQELRGVFEYAHYTTMTLHGEGHYAWDTENPRGIHYRALYFGCFILREGNNFHSKQKKPKN